MERSGIEESRRVPGNVLPRGQSTSRGVTLFFLALFCGMRPIIAQETPSPAPEVSIPSPVASATPARSIRISFLPPPLEGKISLGIYDEWEQLVRILSQEAEVDEFTIGPDALITKWDGKDEYGFDAPAGKYHARGFLVGPMKIEETAMPANEAAPADPVRVKLMPNPLENNERPVVQLSVGFDDENTFLRDQNGLPLFTITRSGDIRAANIAKTKENKTVLVNLTSDAGTRSFRISGVDRMMEFDAGDFELK